MYCIVWRFAWIRNRQYRQLRRLCCEILIHSVFTLPEPLLSASDGILFSGSAGTTACSTAAVPSGYEPCGGVDSESTTSSPFRKGYSPFNGEPNQYHGWMTLQRSLMYEDGLGKVMSGVETAPTALEEDAPQLQRTQYTKETRRFEEKTGNLFRRMLLATADSRDMYASVAAQVVQAYAPVRRAEFGDDRGAAMALEAKYRLDGESRMQELHDQLANLQVTAADKYDPARVIKELRRICVELGTLGDVVVPARKNHAFFRALPDEKYESLKTVLLCDRQYDGSPSKF